MRICHDSNDTLLARCRGAPFENTRVKGYTNFSPKSWITLLHRINVTISNISVNWFNEVCHHSNGTMLARCGVAHFENTGAKCYINFSPKSWITLLHRINAKITNISVNWFNEYMPRLQWHHARPVWSCPLRQHSCQRLHKFQPEIMNHLLHRINVTISNISVNWFNEDMPQFQWHLAPRCRVAHFENTRAKSYINFRQK